MTSSGRRWSLPAEDLSRERSLRDCAFVEFEGVRRRALGRIVLLAKLGRGGMGAVYYGINDCWKTWRDLGLAAIEPHQHEGQALDSRGSWDPVDPWGAHGGRVYATAINCLTLECLGR